MGKEYSMLLEDVFEYGKLSVRIDFKTVISCVMDYGVRGLVVFGHDAPWMPLSRRGSL